MDKRKTISIAVVVVVIFLTLGFIFFQSLQYRFFGDNGDDIIIDNKESKELLINAKHQFNNGAHIVAGEINMPTPCDLLNWDVRILESFPEQVYIDFKTTNLAESCIQVITPARFKVEFTASERAKINATMNGNPAILNLIEALPGEDLDQFELFIKG